jgi:hypothetical protein
MAVAAGVGRPNDRDYLVRNDRCEHDDDAADDDHGERERGQTLQR